MRYINEIQLPFFHIRSILKLKLSLTLSEAPPHGTANWRRPSLTAPTQIIQTPVMIHLISCPSWLFRHRRRFSSRSQRFSSQSRWFRRRWHLDHDTLAPDRLRRFSHTFRWRFNSHHPETLHPSHHLATLQFATLPGFFFFFWPFWLNFFVNFCF